MQRVLSYKLTECSRSLPRDQHITNHPPELNVDSLLGNKLQLTDQLKEVKSSFVSQIVSDHKIVIRLPETIQAAEVPRKVGTCRRPSRRIYKLRLGMYHPR